MVVRSETPTKSMFAIPFECALAGPKPDCGSQYSATTGVTSRV
jgi:hypothetical protein